MIKTEPSFCKQTIHFTVNSYLQKEVKFYIYLKHQAPVQRTYEDLHQLDVCIVFFFFFHSGNDLVQLCQTIPLTVFRKRTMRSWKRHTTKLGHHKIVFKRQRIVKVWCTGVTILLKQFAITCTCIKSPFKKIQNFKNTN